MSNFSISVRVYIEDTDAGGIVFYANYLKYMERARTELLRSFGFPKPALVGQDGLLVVTSVNVDYKRPATLDDEIKVTAVIEKVARVYVVFRQEVWRGDELLCQGTIKVACVDGQSKRPMSLPKDMLEKIREE
jgi:4-hydroxybenzoyl-CoA thioesterase/acyl-CoA thioester hydrolase